MERHLRKGDAFDTLDLVNITNNEGGVRMLRGTGPLKFVQDGKFI